MIKVNIFDERYLDFLCPFYTENLHTIISWVKMNNNKDLSSIEIKFIVLSILDYLLKNKILFVEFGISEGVEFNLSNLNKNEVLKFIDDKWGDEYSFDILYTLAWFKFEDWYRDGLIKIGLNEMRDWKTFVKSEVGDLGNWIEENKPKT